MLHIEWNVESPERARLCEEETQRLVRRLAELGAERVILFGSRARGRAGAESDLDLLVVMPCDPSWTYAHRLAELGEILDPKIATDLLVYTPAEMQRLAHDSALVRHALSEGRVLYSRGEPA